MHIADSTYRNTGHQVNRRLSRRYRNILSAGFISLFIFSGLSPVQAACDPALDSNNTALPNFTCLDTAEAAKLYANPTNYRIMRKGKRIGKHSIQFQQSTDAGADQLTVDVKSRIKVTILKVPVFSFNYQATEIWQNGALTKVMAETTENSKKTVVSATRQATEFVLQRGNTKESVTGLEHASNHWNPAALRSNSLFNTLSGKQNSVKVETIGKSLLDLPAGSIEATHFRYSGTLQAEVWYDNNGRWVQLRFKSDDGSIILYQLDERV